MNPYQYVALRCVPRVDREEFVNVGLVLYCQSAAFLGSAGHLDEHRLSALATEVDVEAVRRALEFAEAVCLGSDQAGAVASYDLGTRFGFLKAPRSTVVQPGPVHGGATADPAAELLRLLDRLVR